MKITHRSLLAFLILLSMLLGMMQLTSFAADGDVEIYLTPNSNWLSDNARFCMYVWQSGGSYLWVEMTDSDGNGVYEGILPAGYSNIIFCRMDPGEEHNGWSTTWNQTSDLKYDGKNNHYTVAQGAWNKGEGKWSVYDSSACVHKYENDRCVNCGEELFYIIAGNVMKKDGEYREGDNSTLFVSSWDVADENNRMFYDSESDCYLKIYENVAKGEYHFKVAENKSWDISYGWDGENCYINVEEDGSMVVITFKDGNITCAARVIEGSFDDTDPDGSAPSTDAGNSDGDDNSDGDEPAPRLNFFQRLWRAIVNFFRNLFGKK